VAGLKVYPTSQVGSHFVPEFASQLAQFVAQAEMYNVLLNVNKVDNPDTQQAERTNGVRTRK